MTLTALRVKNLKAKDRLYRISDKGGLCVEVTPTGSKLWRWRYRFAGKAQTLGLGAYPKVSLDAARRRRDEAKLLVEAGKHPGRERKAERVGRALAHADNFEAVGRSWHSSIEGSLTPKYHGQVLSRLKQHVFPELGFLPISEIGIPDVAHVIDKICKRGTIETAKRVRQLIGQIFRYAALHGKCKFNPAADLRGLLPKRKKKHYASVKPLEFPDLLRKIDGYDGQLLTRAALRLVALTFVRTSELIEAKWSEFDFGKAEWNIPEERMKARRPHFVPLSRQSIAVFDELRALTGKRDYVFHSARGRTGHISNGAILMALRRMGYAGRMTGHGFRTVASTSLNEQRYDRDVIESQLAHGDEDEIRSAYNHAEYRADRVKMMQEWADHLDKLRCDAMPVLLAA